MPRREATGASGGDQADASLVAAACAGDHEAFAQLFRRHGPDIVRSVQRRTGSPALADDVTAAAFERAWRSLTDVHARRIEFRPWIFRIAMNELIDLQRAASRRSQREERHGAGVAAAGVDGDPGSAGDQGVGGIPVEDLRAALTTLSDGHQAVITLRWFAEFEPAEIAATLGISKGAVAVRTHRAMAALRSALGVEPAEGTAQGASR